MKPLFNGVCKCQKCVENSNQTQLKPIIWYTSWYFSRGGVKKIYPPYRILIYAPVVLVKVLHFIKGSSEEKRFNDLDFCKVNCKVET